MTIPESPNQSLEPTAGWRMRITSQISIRFRDDAGEIHAFDGVTYGLQYKKIVSRLVPMAGL